MTLVSRVYDTFFAGQDAYATGYVSNGAVGYAKQVGRPTLAQVEAHLVGTEVLGAYQLTPENTVTWLCFDVDSKVGIDKARGLVSKLSEFLGDVPHVVEFSGGKGYHVWVFFDQAHPASDVMETGKSIREAIGAPSRGKLHIEVFPKQANVKKNGNLVKVPLGKHPKTDNRSRFVNPDQGWEGGESVDPLSAIEKVAALEDLEATLDSVNTVETMAAVIAPYWVDGDRHDTALYLSGFLCNAGWEEQDASDLLEAICRIAGDDSDPDNRQQTVSDTFDKFADGEVVAGYTGLSEIIPAKALQQLQNLADAMSSTPLTSSIDHIRLSKDAAFLKARKGASLIIQFLKGAGRILRDGDDLLWIDDSTHKILEMYGPRWETFLYQHSGIVKTDGFGKSLIEEVTQQALIDAKSVDTYKRSYWDEQHNTMYLNLGGVEVYCIRPTGVTIAFNGTLDILFRNTNDGVQMPNLLKLDGLKSVDPWKYLIDDVSFATTENTEAAPEEQAELVKAWILATFFNTIMPTRPLLTSLGPAGSGKTTFARRILRFLEDPAGDVLGLVGDKPDSLRASLVRHKVLVLDNLEKVRAHWLLDTLNRVSTGNTIEIRKLYKTNEVYVIQPDTFVICTAIEMPFSDESIFSRMLPVEMDQLAQPKPEYAMQKELKDNQAGMWLGMIEILQRAVTSLSNNKQFKAPVDIRLADFSSFVARLHESPDIDGKLALSGLAGLGGRQKKVLEESSPFIQALEAWMAKEPAEASAARSLSSLYSLVSERARRDNIDWNWKSPQGLSGHLRMLDDVLKRNFGMNTEKVYNSTRGRDEITYSFEVAQVDMGADLMSELLSTNTGKGYH